MYSRDVDVSQSQVLNINTIEKQAVFEQSGLPPQFNLEQFINYQIASLQGLSAVQQAMAKAQKPFSGVSINALAKVVNDVDLSQPLADFPAVLEELKGVYLDHAVYFHHPRYMAHLNCPVTYPAVVAEHIIAAINTSVDTWDQSAGATLIEQKLIDWTCQKAALPSTADGVFTSGGTQSNLMAMLVAREVGVTRYAPEHQVKLQGLPAVASRFKIYCSEVAHFSIQKAAALLGLGYNAVVPVATNREMQMDMEALKTAIATSKAQGDLPIAVVITAGTTDFGSIDPIHNIAMLAKEEQLWCHVDGAYGGGLLVSEHHRNALNGIELVDSITIDYHKSFMQPVSCSAFLLSDKRYFSHITLYADYLNPLAEAGNGTPNLVDKSLQTTRRFDALKLWLTLRTTGEAPLGRAFDKVIGLARQTHIVLNDHPDFEVVNYPELSALVFRFAPDDLKHDLDLLDSLNLHVRQTFLKTGEAMIARTKINGRHYLKFTLLNAQCQLSDVRAVIEKISHIAWQTYREIA